jgi:hypothetical protein
MDQVQILFPAGSGVSQGELIDIHIYTDPDGDGDPATGMQLRHSIRNAAVEAVDGITWSSYSAASLHFTESHDIMIAVVNRTAGTDLGEKPAALDQTTSLGQSWIGINASETISDPPTFPTDIVWGTTDSVGFPGNWMIRATTRLPAAAEAAHPVPSMTAVGSVLLTLLMVAFGGAYRNRKENLENG